MLLPFLSHIAVFYFIEADIWIKPKGFIPGRRLAQIIGWSSLNLDLPTNGLCHFQIFLLFQHKSIFNWTSGINITMPYLRKSWLQIITTSILDKFLG